MRESRASIVCRPRTISRCSLSRAAHPSYLLEASESKTYYNRVRRRTWDASFGRALLEKHWSLRSKKPWSFLWFVPSSPPAAILLALLLLRPAPRPRVRPRPSRPPPHLFIHLPFTTSTTSSPRLQFVRPQHLAFSFRHPASPPQLPPIRAPSVPRLQARDSED
jgi:hypothetical protein